MSEVLEVRSVSRKTARDGKHEISSDTAARLRGLASPLTVIVDGVRDRGSVASMPCTCRPEAHEHWFIQSDALRSLEAGREATTSLGADGA
ncbi:MAG TPA: hypothetical protein VJ650_05095, partial [Gemmatimonadaceae bacterium]|nr:hypothetical protein [Gemmatimonadaceae bacterium]